MSHWQTGTIELKCSLNILKKALINVMPDWEQSIQVEEEGGLVAKFHNASKGDQFQMVVSDNHNVSSLYGDIGFYRNEDGTWEIGGDYNIESLKKQLIGDVMRMKAIAIARMRGYEVLRNYSNEDEIVTDIRVDIEKAKELLS